MSTISKKIFAIVTTLTVSVMLVGPGAAQALTADELQAQINLLLQQLTALQSQLSVLQGGTSTTGGGPAACSGITFDRNLVQGMSGNDVKCLQALFNQSADTQVAASGVGSAGNETVYFGSLTKAAAVKFQEKHSSDVLTPVGLTQGTGFVGPSTRSKLNAVLAASPATPGTPIPGIPSGPAGENKVQLAADSPAAATVAKGAQDVIFAKINFCAASIANTVSKVILTRSGIAQDADLSYVKLYDGMTQIGATQALNQTTHKASFSSLNVVIPANSCKTLTAKASIATGATTGDTPKLGIASASDITSTVALDGIFPINSNGMTIAGISVGQVLVEAQTTPSGSIIAGGMEQAVAAFKFTASSTEGVKINSVTLREVGSSVDSDVSNIKLFYGSTQLGSTVASLSNGLVTFDLSSVPVEVLAGASKILTVYVDLGTSTGVASRTVRFEITQYTDVSIYGTNSGGTVVARGGSSWAADTWPQQGASISATLGTLTISQDTSWAPSSQTYTVGTEGNLMNAFKFSTGAYEAVRVTQIKLNATGTGASSDSNVSNIALYSTDGTLIAGPAGMISGVVTFGSYTTGLDVTGLFDILKSSNKTILVKADIPSGAAASSTATSSIGFEIRTPNSNVKADGITSMNDLATTDISPSTTLPATQLVHPISSSGSLTVSLNASSPAAATYALGTQAYEFAKFDFTSTGEDIVVSQINILFVATSVSDTTFTAAAGDVNNIRLYDGNTLLGTDPTISSGKAEFGVNLTVPKNTVKTLSVIGDIPSASATSVLRAAVSVASDVVSTGKDSGVSLTTSGSFAVYANSMTKGTPTLTVKAATIPVAQTYIKGTKNAHIGTFYFTASTAENVRLTSIRVAIDYSTGTVATSAFAYTDYLDASGYVSNVKIFDGSTQVGSTQPTLTAGTNYDYVTFSGLNLNIPKGTTKSIDIKLDILNNYSTSTGIFSGIAVSTDVSGTGASSGQAASITLEGGGIAGTLMTLGSAGTLALQLDVNTPVAAQVISGTTNNEFGRWKFTASNEDILLSKLTFEVIQSGAGGSTSTPSSTGRANALPTMGVATSGASYGFNYSLNDGATSTCIFSPDSTTTAAWVTAINIGGCTGIWATQSSNIFTILATSSYSLEIRDASAGATNTADDMLLGLKYGGTETIDDYAGSNNSIVKASLWDGTTKLSEAVVGAETANKLIFNFSSGSEIRVDRLMPKNLSVKLDLSNYQGAVEGSTIRIDLGTSTANYTSLITAVGGSSGTTLSGTSSINYNTTATSTVLAGSAMRVYSTKPTISLAAGSPSGAKGVSPTQEVFVFDVANNESTGFDLDINAIRFTLTPNNSTTAATLSGGTWYLYKRTEAGDTLVGQGTPHVASSTAYLAIYPYTGFTVGNNSTNKYSLTGYTAGMDISSSATESLTVSIQANDFYWDDSASIPGAVNARSNVRILPVTGGTLTY